MRKFWGLYDNGKYKVGCNSATMYLYDTNGQELAKFKDISYAYCGAFVPQSNIFLLRSTEGRIAVYDCDERKLLHKFRFSSINHSQDDGFCFTHDGAYFLNIERAGTCTRTRLSIYETQTFSLVKRLFGDNESLVLNDIEWNAFEDKYTILFFTRNSEGVYSQGYVGELKEDRIINTQPIDSVAHNFLRSYKSLETMGFTEKAMEWSVLHYTGYTNDEILRLSSRNIDMFSFPQIAGEVVK